MGWKEDQGLKECLEELVRKNFKQTEIIDFVNRDFSHLFSKSKCSIRTSKRVLKYFSIKYIGYGVSIDKIKETILFEWNGPGRDLGYRSMARKL